MLMCVLLVNFAMSALALQAQTQTHAIEVLQDRGAASRTQETMWTWGESCEVACTALCSSATCNPYLAAHITDESKMAALSSSGLDLSVCQTYLSQNYMGPGTTGADGGNLCFPGDGTVHACGDSTEGEGEFLCACNVIASTCTISEDPHVNGFDDAQVSLMAAKSTNFQDIGDKWLVSSGRVKIQARFMKKNEDPSSDQNMFARAIALGGDVLNGNVMVIGSLADSITWNGQPVLQSQGSSFRMEEASFFVDATRGSSSLVQNLTQANPGVNIRLQSGVSLIVNRLQRYINIAIKMPLQAGGQEGLCGNFNGFGGDDEIDMANRRFDINVAPDESLFAGLTFE